MVARQQQYQGLLSKAEEHINFAKLANTENLAAMSEELNKLGEFDLNTKEGLEAASAVLNNILRVDNEAISVYKDGIAKQKEADEKAAKQREEDKKKKEEAAKKAAKQREELIKQTREGAKTVANAAIKAAQGQIEEARSGLMSFLNQYSADRDASGTSQRERMLDSEVGQYFLQQLREGGAAAANARAFLAQPMAQGGIVRRPTFAMIGESGPEAVIPLNGNRGMGVTNYTINFYGNVSDRAAFKRDVKEVINEGNRRNQLTARLA